MATMADVARCGNTLLMQEEILRAGGESSISIMPAVTESSAGVGREAFHELLRQDSELNTVVVYNEPTPPAIMAAAMRTARLIPENPSLVSIDLPAQAAQQTVPSMTTVNPSAAATGRAAVDFLIRRVEGEPAIENQVLFNNELQLRGGRGPPRPAAPSAIVGRRNRSRC